MTNYRKSMMESLAEVRGLQEDNMDMMRKAAGGAMQTIKMKDGKLQMDSFTASAIMQVYDKVNPANQKKMAVMINKGTKAGMLKLQSFAMKQVKSEYEPQLDEWTVSDVEIAMKKKYGKIDKEAIEKLKKVQHRGNVDRNDLVKAGHGKLDVAGLAYSKEEVELDEIVPAVAGVARVGAKVVGKAVKKGAKKVGRVAGRGTQKLKKKIHKATADEFNLDEAKYELYHKDFSTAMQHAYKMAKKLYGITVDPKEIDDKVASGPRKPSSGKTNSYRLKGDKGAIQVQVYNMDRLRSHKQLPADKKYELNMYKEEVELDEAVKEYDVKIKVGSKTNSYNIMSKDELSAAQSVLHSIMARSKTGGSPGLDAVRKQYPDMKSLNKKGVSVSIKEESELDEGREKDARQLVNPNKEVMVVKKNRVVVINKKDQDKYLKQGWELAEEVDLDENKLPDMREALRQVRTEKPIQLDEEVELDEGIKVGDNVHLGFGAKGGTGFKGKVIKIDSNNVHIKNSEGKEYKGPMKFVTKEEVELDEGKFERDMDTARGISLQIRIIGTARNMIDDGKSDSEIMKTTKLSAGDVKKLRQDMSDRPGEYDEEAELEEGKMKELHGYIAQGKSAEWIAKKMKVDVEAIKTLMAGYNESYEIGTNEYRDYLEKLTPGEGTQEASAQADAMRAMRRGKKEVDPADIDTDASPEDRAAADKNIIMQLRGVVSLKGVGKMILTPQQARNLKKKDSKYLKTLGSGFVEFEKGHEKVDLKVAQAILNKFNSLKKPTDKAKFQAKVAKSYKDMLKALKEEIELDEALPSHLKKFFDKDGNPKSKEGKAAWERLAKMKGFKKYTSKQVKMAIGIAFDKRYVQGNMTGAVNAIEKIAKGLSEIEPVRNALRRANENTILDRINRKLKERKELHEASNRWELGGKKFSLVNDKGTWILVTQGTGKEQKLKAKTAQDATQELVKKGYRES